jgi:hypothetical protein
MPGIFSSVTTTSTARPSTPRARISRAWAPDGAVSTTKGPRWKTRRKVCEHLGLVVHEEHHPAQAAAAGEPPDPGGIRDRGGRRRNGLGGGRKSRAGLRVLRDGLVHTSPLPPQPGKGNAGSRHDDARPARSPGSPGPVFGPSA